MALFVSHREKEPRRHAFGAESLPEKGGSSKSKKNGGNSRTPQGKTEAVQGDEGMLETHAEAESRATPEEEGMGGFGDKESQARKDQRMQTLNPRTASSPSSLIVQPFVPRWFSQPQQFQRQIRENLIPLQDVPVIHPKLRKKLQANGIASLFPVQAEVIPAILDCGPNGALAGRGGYPPSDICVSAPTGSGKTLAFIIPVVQALLDRVVCHVRALAVLPTKELAQQVAKIFNIYTDGTGLKVVQLTGQKSFVKEQESLVETRLMGLRSLADIVVATPGRLVDHLQQSPQFSLRELRFLIIDEADRMIDNMHQDWLQQVVEAVHRPEAGSGPSGLFRRVQPSPCTAARTNLEDGGQTKRAAGFSGGRFSLPCFPFQGLLPPAPSAEAPLLSHSDTEPREAAGLGLYQPRLFMPVQSGKGSDVLGSQPCVSEKYLLPEGLSVSVLPWILFVSFVPSEEEPLPRKMAVLKVVILGCHQKESNRAGTRSISFSGFGDQTPLFSSFEGGIDTSSAVARVVNKWVIHKRIKSLNRHWKPIAVKDMKQNFYPLWLLTGLDKLFRIFCSRQYYVPCSLNWKPLFLLHFLVRLKFSQVLCFTNSKETSHRLFLLIQAFGGVKVAEFSSKLSPSKRKATLKEFEQGKIQLLISTDATARGIDFGGVKCVISYDAPQFIRTYIHRVGRTARAGKAGLAFSLLLKRQEHRFLKMLKDAGLPELQPQLVKSTSIQPLFQEYEAALAKLAQTVKEEQVGKRS
ncbi:hypothetical protein E2320_012811 [Naja naja]|nr:hypothetical protein E2320_012811 [Naja naja]